MPASEQAFCWLSPSLVVPMAALDALLAIERAGHTVQLDGDDLVVDRGRGCRPLDPVALDELRRWKAHCWLIVRHCTTDTRGDRQRKNTSTRRRPAIGRDARSA